MIYNKDAAFPYPVLSNTSSSYLENYFKFDIDDNISVDNEHYIFPISYEVSSPFIQKLLQENKATLVLIAQSGDNYFERISYGQREVVLKKNRFALQDRTKLQLHIQSLETIKFSEAEDLNLFYQEFKEELQVKRYGLLGYSNEVILDENTDNAVDLFEQTIREEMTVPFKVELTSETIVLQFNSREIVFETVGLGHNLKNMYIYLGLNRALSDFIDIYSESEDGGKEEFVDVASVSMPQNILHDKLRDLMLSKNITEISKETLDEIIQQMTDGIIEKFVASVKELNEHAN